MKYLHRYTLPMVLATVVALLSAGCGTEIAERNFDQAPQAVVSTDEVATSMEPILDTGDIHEEEGHAAVHEDGDLHEIEPLINGHGEEELAAVHEDGDLHEIEPLIHSHDEEDTHEAVGLHDEAEAMDDVTNITLTALEGRPWSFEPSLIEVQIGKPIRLTLVNNGATEHDVEVAGLWAENIELIGGLANDDMIAGGHHHDDVVAAHAMPGTTASVTFTPMQPGKYEFACTLPGHKAAGMVGTLIVSPEMAISRQDGATAAHIAGPMSLEVEDGHGPDIHIGTDDLGN